MPSPTRDPPCRVPGPLVYEGLMEIICVFWRPYWPLLLYPVASPAKGGSQPFREPAPLSGLPSGLSLQCLLWAAGSQSWLPPIFLLSSCPLTPPARPGVSAACPLPACLPACSMPKPSACRLLERTNSLPGPAPLPNPASPGGAVPARIPHLQEDTGKAWGPAPAHTSLNSAGQAGRLTDEPTGQRVAFP